MGSCGGLREPLGALGLSFGKVCWLLGGIWDALSALLGVLGGPFGALGSTYKEPRAHFGRQLQRNHWFQRRPLGRGWSQDWPKHDSGRQLQRNQRVFVPWRILGDSRKHCGAFKLNQSSFWLTVAAKSMVLKPDPWAVSYTHLTLPTIYSV